MLDLSIPQHTQPMIKGFETQVRSSVLASDEGQGRCHQVMTLGLDFEGHCPRTVMKARLAEAGHASPEVLREHFALPTVPLLCKVMEESRDRLKVSAASDQAVFYQALMLGLCNAQRFDPARPVIWTEQSLTRAVVLYNPAGFYQ